MAWCPFAIHKPLSENHTQGGITPRAIILHTAVSNADSLFNFFQNSSDLESHFYVRDDGTIEQYMDTGIRADANKNANDFAVSIETWDGGTIRLWTTAQMNALVRLCDWLCRTHNIPRVRIPNAYGAGIGWHVQFGAPGPWTPVSKACPGGPRIEQVKNVIIPRVASGQIEERDMDATQDAKLTAIWDWSRKLLRGTIEGSEKVEADSYLYLINSRIGSVGTAANNAFARATEAKEAAQAAAIAVGGLSDTIGAKVHEAVFAYFQQNPPVVNVDVAAIADELDRRARDGDPSTGPVTYMPGMEEYRLKAVPVWAEKVEGATEELIDMAERWGATFTRTPDGAVYLKLPTVAGRRGEARPGDWLMQSEAEGAGCCRDDEFEASFEKVER